MTGSEHWTTPSKNRYGNYEKMMKMKRARAVARAGASPAPTIDDRIVSFVRKCKGQSRRSMVGATLAVALPQFFVRKCKGQSRRSMVGATLAVALSQLAVALVSASLALVFAFLLPIPLAHAAANGRIFGQLLDGTKKNAP